MGTPFNPETFVTYKSGGPKKQGGELLLIEVFWRKHCQFLKDHGYTLRPRYQPDWRPSWLDTSKDWLECEDGVFPRSTVLDATRSDGTLVMIKAIHRTRSPDEIPVGKLLSSEGLVSPRNHCIPYLEIIDPPEGSDEAFVVLPLLVPTELAPFETIGEAVEFFRQIFEGLEFMHEHNIAHEDCKYDNIMADSHHLFDAPPHPFERYMKRDFSGPISVVRSRTRKPVKYYLIDFDLSKEYPPGGPPRLEEPPWGGDKTVPEHLLPEAPPCDPFPVDVYCLGNCVRKNFLDGYQFRKGRKGFEFMRGLVNDMTNPDPLKRPQMSEAASRLNSIIDGLSDWQLRSPIVEVGQRTKVTTFIRHWTKQLVRKAQGTPAIPKV
ncbi:hypothetical protein E4T56_gene19050 [Termitomyces sp. T112]|nr:hypothetical protein E4T56_gene19050 [Termitomyces sp. T112]